MFSDCFTALGYRSSDAQQLSNQVWSVWHTKQQRWDCLKLAESNEQRYCVRREAHWLKQLMLAGYAYCAIFRGHYQVAGYEVLVTSQLSGETLSVVLDQKRSVSATFAHQLFHAIKALHLLDICHVDLKPSNIICTTGGPLLVDFASAVTIGTKVTDMPYRSFSPSYSLPSLQQGEGYVDATQDWYSYFKVLHLLNAIEGCGRNTTFGINMNNDPNVVIFDTGIFSEVERNFLSKYIGIINSLT